MNIALALGAGIGIGFCLGLLFSRTDTKRMFELVTVTSDSLVRSALFPGLPKEAFEPPKDPEPAEAMYETENEEAQMPDWLRSDAPWDMTEVER